MGNLDMSQFAVNIQTLLKNDVWFNQNSKQGFIASNFLASFALVNHFEPKADCKDVITQ